MKIASEGLTTERETHGVAIPEETHSKSKAQRPDLKATTTKQRTELTTIDHSSVNKTIIATESLETFHRRKQRISIVG